MKKVIILIGAPGSGKGTQSKILTKSYNIAHISTGDMLRLEISSGTALGLKIKDLISSGGLVDDNTMTNLIESRINQEDCCNGFILDGYPRTLEQARMLDELFSKYSIDNYKVVEIVISQEVLIKRITGRFTCSSCGFIYNEFFNQPKISGVCDSCSSTSFNKRSDDNEETLKQRLDIYSSQSEPILKFYEDRGLRYLIDGSLDIKKSKDKLLEIIG